MITKMVLHDLHPLGFFLLAGAFFILKFHTDKI